MEDPEVKNRKHLKRSKSKKTSYVLDPPTHDTGSKQNLGRPGRYIHRYIYMRNSLNEINEWSLTCMTQCLAIHLGNMHGALMALLRRPSKVLLTDQDPEISLPLGPRARRSAREPSAVHTSAAPHDVEEKVEQAMPHLAKQMGKAKVFTEEFLQNLRIQGHKRPLPSFEDLRTEEGEAWTGDAYWGASTARNHLVCGPDPGQKVTKSCHFCQNQHIWVPCGTGDLMSVKKDQGDLAKSICQKSFCVRWEISGLQ